MVGKAVILISAIILLMIVGLQKGSMTVDLVRQINRQAWVNLTREMLKKY